VQTEGEIMKNEEKQVWKTVKDSKRRVYKFQIDYLQ
jgi:hypothetical protein